MANARQTTHESAEPTAGPFRLAADGIVLIEPAIGEPIEFSGFAGRFAPPETATPARYWDIWHRPDECGGSYELRLFECGQHVGGGLFPAMTEFAPNDPGWNDAVREGCLWHASRRAHPAAGDTISGAQAAAPISRTVSAGARS